EHLRFPILISAQVMQASAFGKRPKKGRSGEETRCILCAEINRQLKHQVLWFIAGRRQQAGQWAQALSAKTGTT
ncbi:MAG TPA: hypothetical protein P5316_21185, partial [Phycisphaerae bacterium]|nr:hypothetical protein [Phycisphaerae bacterium]